MIPVRLQGVKQHEPQRFEPQRHGPKRRKRRRHGRSWYRQWRFLTEPSSGALRPGGQPCALCLGSPPASPRSISHVTRLPSQKPSKAGTKEFRTKGMTSPIQNGPNCSTPKNSTPLSKGLPQPIPISRQQWPASLRLRPARHPFARRLCRALISPVPGSEPRPQVHLHLTSRPFLQPMPISSALA
jgi:hypothetical protein